jgi:hypothetical protein
LIGCILIVVLLICVFARPKRTKMINEATTFDDYADVPAELRGIKHINISQL